MNIFEENLYKNKLLFNELGSVYINELSTLVVSDLHLGKGISFMKDGYPIPPFDTNETLFNLEKTISFFSPETVISLGDSFHKNDSLAKINDTILKRINLLEKKYRFLWILGNHDNHLNNKKRLSGIIKPYYKKQKFFFRHIKKDSRKNSNFEFSGHFHPKYILKHNGVYHNYKCFVLGKNFCILPSFGTYTGGLDVNSEEFKKVLQGQTADLIVIGKRSLIKKQMLNDSNQR